MHFIDLYFDKNCVKFNEQIQKSVDAEVIYFSMRDINRVLRT